jgi:hypothetical protein
MPGYRRNSERRRIERPPAFGHHLRRTTMEAKKPAPSKLADLPSAGKTLDPKRAQEVKGGIKYTMFLADGTPCS